MKKIILTASLIGLMHGIGLCQGPTLYNYNTVFKIGESENIIMADTTGVTSNITGSNCIWDYSTLSVTTKTAFTNCYDPETTPYTSYFNNATIAGGTGIGSLYTYFYADTNEYTFLGLGTSSFVKINTDPEKMFTFPFSYGSQMTDSFYGTYTLSGKLHTSSGYRTNVGDGWGTLKLPKNTYPNVIRIKTDIYSKDTASGEKTETYATSFRWYDGINKTNLLQISFTKMVIYGTPKPTYDKWVSVGAFTEATSVKSSFITSSLNIYPNPAIKVLNIELELKQQANVDISLIDLLGNIVRPIDTKVIGLGKYHNTIDISGLPKGIYAVKIITGQEVEIKRIIIQ